ncbi:MAG: hypothetical protein V1806_03460 [Pseudomonadota bacterium]
MDDTRALYAILAGLMFMAIAIGRGAEVPRRRRPWGYLAPGLSFLLGLVFLLAGLRIKA